MIVRVRDRGRARTHEKTITGKLNANELQLFLYAEALSTRIVWLCRYFKHNSKHVLMSTCGLFSLFGFRFSSICQQQLILLHFKKRKDNVGEKQATPQKQIESCRFRRRHCCYRWQEFTQSNKKWFDLRQQFLRIFLFRQFWKWKWNGMNKQCHRKTSHHINIPKKLTTECRSGNQMTLIYNFRNDRRFIFAESCCTLYIA